MSTIITLPKKQNETEKPQNKTENQPNKFVSYIFLGLIVLVTIGTINNASAVSSCQVQNQKSYLEIERSTQCLSKNNQDIPQLSKVIETDEAKAKDRLDGALMANTQTQKALTNNGEFCLVNGLQVKRTIFNGEVYPCPKN